MPSRNPRLFNRSGQLRTEGLADLVRATEQRSRVYPVQPFVDCGSGLAVGPPSLPTSAFLLTTANLFYGPPGNAPILYAPRGNVQFAVGNEGGGQGPWWTGQKADSFIISGTFQGTLMVGYSIQVSIPAPSSPPASQDSLWAAVARNGQYPGGFFMDSLPPSLLPSSRRGPVVWPPPGYTDWMTLSACGPLVVNDGPTDVLTLTLTLGSDAQIQPTIYYILASMWAYLVSPTVPAAVGDFEG